MVITREQALTSDYFHAEPCFTTDPGPRGGQAKVQIEVWRRNGRTKTWKTRPGEFRIPVKNGLYRYLAIDHTNSHKFHVESECEAVHGPKPKSSYTRPFGG